MNQKIQQELELIKESVLKTVPAEAIYLFGSYAYGTPKEDSDLDIYVVVPLGELYTEIRKNTRYKRTLPIDLLMGRSSVFNRRKNGPTLDRMIAQKGVPLYGS